MAIIEDRNLVPICRACNIGHWSDTVTSDGFCSDCTKARIQLRKEGYYWIEDKNHAPLIAYYGPGTGIDQIDRTKRVISEWSWCLSYEDEDMGDSLDEDTIKVLSDRIPEPLE